MLRQPLVRFAQSTRRSISSSAVALRERSLPATFYRGGTSKALVFNAADLPRSQQERDAIFLSAMGSPDPNGRQLDGMGGGYSSVSKIAIVAKSDREDADVEYTFGQVLVDKPVVDYSSNCGNMLAAVGPFALEHSLVPPSQGEAIVRILNTNTGKLIHSRFPADGQRAILGGDYAIDGVSGSHARITLDFVNPEGSRTGVLLPTGSVIDDLELPNNSGIVRATLMDCGNPCVFVLAQDLGIDPTILPPDLEKDKGMLRRLDYIRNAAAVKMGLVTTLDAAQAAKSVPKVCIVSRAAEHTVLSGATIAAHEVDLVVRCTSSGDPHRALPITAALCIAAAAQVQGSLVHSVTRPRDDGITIGHASGTITVDADMTDEGDGKLHVPRARVFRTARKLFEGQVFYDDETTTS